ncbi:MAG: AraC family transcriptional regulator, partial [Steroidobacteraceae bacterium]
MPSCPPVVTRIRALGFDEASEQIAPLARVNYVQLERGAACVQGAIACLNGSVIGHLGGNRNRIVRLESAPGRLLVAVGVRGAARVGTSAIGAGDAVILSRATDVVTFCDRSFLSVSLSVEHQDFQQTAADMKLDIFEPGHHASVLKLPGESLRELTDIAQEILEPEGDSLMPSVMSVAVLDDMILRWCVRSISSPRERRYGAGEPAARRRAALRAREFVDAHLDQPLSLGIVCRASYCSARALEYGFRELFELSPMAYVRLARLSRVRRDLAALAGRC